MSVTEKNTRTCYGWKTCSLFIQVNPRSDSNMHTNVIIFIIDIVKVKIVSEGDQEAFLLLPNTLDSKVERLAVPLIGRLVTSLNTWQRLFLTKN